MSQFDIIAFPPRPDGKQWVWELGPSTRDANRIRQTQPAVPETLTESERAKEAGK